MNYRLRLWGVACCTALLLTFNVADAAARVPHVKGEPRADAPQRRRARRTVKKRRATKVPTKESRVAEGVWGGAHLRMNVSGEGASLDFDCANGQIAAPFVADAEGGFDLPGTYTREGPGPIRIGREPSARPARYTGRVEGERMTLSVRLEGSATPLAEFTLTHGSEGRVVKCR